MEKASSLATRYERHYRLLWPFVALASGIASLVLLRRGVNFAPVAAASVLVAWTLGAGITRWLPENPEAPKWRRIIRFLASGFVAGLYQDVLFFLLPVWFGSATWPSINMIAPAFLGAMAIFSCFEDSYERWVMSRPLMRALFSAVVLFATLCAATPVLIAAPLRPSLAVSAALAGLLGALAVIPRERLRERRTQIAIAIGVVAAAGLMVVVAPILPPVPVQSLKATAARRIADREPVEPSDVFELGIPKVYTHFAVAAPAHFSERVHFRWALDGNWFTKEFATEISGGRKTGFRTWGVVSKPRAGHWTVELLAESGQLIGRTEFEIAPGVEGDVEVERPPEVKPALEAKPAPEVKRAPESRPGPGPRPGPEEAEPEPAKPDTDEAVKEQEEEAPPEVEAEAPSEAAE